MNDQAHENDNCSEIKENFLDETIEGVDNLSEQETSQETQSVVQETADAINQSLVKLGFINFDSSNSDNITSNALVSEELRKHFRRDVYVGISDKEQGKEFLGRIVEGPFHSPHEVSKDSSITRTTVLHPERTHFRPSYYVEGTIEILGELVADERLVPSPTRPRPYSEIYIFPPDRLQRFLGISGSFILGKLSGYAEVDVYTEVNSKNFLPRNVGVFGTIGSGKSNTTQVLIEEALKANWAVVVIDVEGEYVRMDQGTEDISMRDILASKYSMQPEGVRNVSVYVPQAGNSEAMNPIAFKVPVSTFDPFILSELMELSEPQERCLEGLMALAPTRPKSNQRQGILAANQPTSSNRPFTLQDLINALEDKPLWPTGTAESTAVALRSKLVRLGRTNMLDWNATNMILELPFDDILVEGKLSILDVSETDDKARNIAIAYTLQGIFKRVIETAQGEMMSPNRVRPKVMVVIEEIHTFVSRANVSKMRSVLDNLQTISRRGRKRWMSLVLVSQQPGHVPDELFELTNTRFIHQLKSVANLAPVKQTTGGVHEALWANITSLGPGQCLLTSAVFKNPLFVDIRPAKSKRMLVT